MRWIKENKKDVIFFAVFFGLIIAIMIFFLVLWFGGSRDKYGARLEGIEEVALSDSYIKDIDANLKKNDIVTDSSTRVSGRIVNVILTVKDDTKLADAKALKTNVIESFTEDELAFYDIQIFIKVNDSSKESYPVIGYKHKTSKDVVWSNN